VLRKKSLLDEADGYSRHIARLGRRAKSPELLIRAMLGYSASAQIRGNYPQVRHHSRRALRIAESAKLDNLARDARTGLMIALGAARQFDEALITGWKAYLGSIGDPVDEGEILGNLGQVLLESGHYDEARAGFAAVVSSQQPAHILLPALGGLAIASAMTGHPEMVEWAASEITRFATSLPLRYEIASALLEAAIGLYRIGRIAAADRCRAAAIELARTHNFHEIVFRGEAMASNIAAESEVTPELFTREAATVATEVAWLEPKQLPEHVALAVASS
jgi:tetratricopeptide (TPR) repeat protein